MSLEEIGKADVLAPRQKIDICMPAHGQLNHSMECIQSIYQNTAPPFHLIICDDSQTSISGNKDNPVDTLDISTEYFERLAKKYNNITYLKKDKPYISGNQFFNDAIAHMETPYLATIMNSVRVEPDWDRVAVKMMNENPKIGVIGFKCIFADANKIECAGIEIANGHMPIDIGRDLPAHYMTTIYEVQAIQWAFALLRREAVEGNLDENLFYGFKGWDDIDNCYVVKSKGWKVFYCGYGAGIHHPRATRGTNSNDGYLKNKENARRFWKRWGMWNKYLESRTMDVADKLSQDTKSNLKAVYNEYNMCASIVQQSQMMLDGRRQVLNNLISNALTNECKVSPEDYLLGFDPSKDIWDLKRKPVPENTDTATKPNEVPKAIETKEVIEVARKNREAAVQKALQARNEANQRVEDSFENAKKEADQKFTTETTKVLGAK